MFRPARRPAVLLSLALASVLGMTPAIRLTIHPPSPSPVPAPAAVPVPRSVPTPITDPLYAQQWNLAQIRVPDAWAVTPGAPVTVAVLDTGYVQSDELTGREVNGYDFVSDTARSGDGDGRDADATGIGPLSFHAEVVANLIAAARDGRGVVGVNPQARIVHVRVGGTDGLIAPQDLSDALRWAAGLPVSGVPANPNPAKIMNLSLYADFIPLTGCDARVNAAIQAVVARGVLVVAGAANDGADSAGYTPAGCRNVLTVTAVDRSGQRPDYANWGSVVAVAAPGGTRSEGLPLWSRGALTLRNGTSFSAPQVAGVASLMLGVNPSLKPATLISMLRATAAAFPGGQCDLAEPLHTCGAGTVDAGAAVKLASQRAAVLKTPAPRIPPTDGKSGNGVPIPVGGRR